MANSYNGGKQWLLENDLLAVAAAGDLFFALFKTTYTFDQDSDITWSNVSASEITGVSGYTVGGIAMTSVAINKLDGSDEAEAEAARAAFGNLGVGDTVGSGIVYENVGAGAPTGTDPLLGYVELTNTPTNGQAFSIDFSGANPGRFLALTHA